MIRNSTAHRVLVAGVCVTAVAGCTATTGTTRSGGPAAPVTLTLGLDDREDAPTAPVVEAFAARVAELSDGALVVEPVWGAGRPDGQEQPEWDQRVIRMLVGGDLDMALVPTRAWDTEGVTTLRPFSVPFLVDSEPLAEAVVTGDVAADLLVGLEDVGVTGLALVPQGLRYVFSYGEPMTAPEAFAGRTVRAPRSATAWAAYEAWGATAADLVGPAFDAAVQNAEVAGAESTFTRAGGLPGGGTVAAGDLPVSANVHAIAVSTGVLDELPAEQAAVLRQAALDVRDDVVAEPAGEAVAAEEYCSGGGRVVTAGAGARAALEAAAGPVVAELTADPVTADLVAGIGRLRDGLPQPAVVAPCTGTGTGGSGAATTPDTGATFPEGVYRTELDAAALQAAGMSATEARNHAGVWTLTFAGGTVVVEDVRAADGRRSQGDGNYCVADARVVLAQGPGEGCDGERALFSAAWTLEGRELRFVDIAPEDAFVRALWGSATWTRID